MKYLKILLLLITFSSICNASYLLDKNYPLCIDDYYYKSGSIYYLRSSDSAWYYSTEDHTAQQIYSGYIYDSVSGQCNPLGLNEFGLTVEQFNFLMALIGVVFGGVFLFFSVDAFVKVGGKK